MLMRDIFKSRIFWLSFLACIGVIFLVALSLNRTYQSEVEIIFLPKNAHVTNSMNAVLSNAKQIVSSTYFYRKLVERNQDIEDPVDQLPEYKRKEYWNKTVTAERLEDSFVLRIKAVHKDREQVELLAFFTAKDIMSVMSKYYDIRNDLEMRVVESVFTRSVVTAWTWKWFLSSIAGGFILAIAITWVLVQRRKEDTSRSSIQSPKPWYLPSKQDINSAVNLEKEILRKEDIQTALATFKKDSSVKKKEIIPTGKKASAPENLPVGSEFTLQEESPKLEEKKPEKILDHEATPEEVKRRLNKLLKGEM